MGFQSRDVRREGGEGQRWRVEVEVGVGAFASGGLQRGAAALTGPPVAVCGK